MNFVLNNTSRPIMKQFLDAALTFFISNEKIGLFKIILL